MATDAQYDAPTPRVLYIHDDLSGHVRRRRGADSLTYRVTQELLTLVRREPRRVVVLTVEEQIAALLERGGHTPFGMALVIGQAGERVARQVHQRTGWFPNMRRVESHA